MLKDEMIIRRLSYLVRTYGGVRKLIVATKNRLHAMNPDEDVETNWIINGMTERKGGQSIRYSGLQNIKNKLSSEIKKELAHWEISEWLDNVPGIGPHISGNLILLYYYRFIPVCKKCNADLVKKDSAFVCPACGKKAMGDGVLRTRIDFTKNFRQVSSWWHYLGRHQDENGEMPKRKSGEETSWSTRGRDIAYEIGDQFNRQQDDNPYKAFLLDAKAKHEEKNKYREKPWSKGHIHNAARHQAAKLFLSHFWHVARLLEGLPTSGPWVIEHGGHNTVITPYFFDEDLFIISARKEKASKKKKAS